MIFSILLIYEIFQMTIEEATVIPVEYHSGLKLEVKLVLHVIEGDHCPVLNAWQDVRIRLWPFLLFDVVLDGNGNVVDTTASGRSMDASTAPAVVGVAGSLMLRRSMLLLLAWMTNLFWLAVSCAIISAALSTNNPVS